MVGLSTPCLCQVAHLLTVSYTGGRITYKECGRVVQPNRVPIWSVLDEDQRWYAWLFPSLWLLGTIYHAILRISVHEGSVALRFGDFTKDVGIVGLSAAILALMVIAGRRTAMALFDWRNSDKSRAQGRQEADREWHEWMERRDAALKEGREFTEPSPAQTRREKQVA